MVAVTIHRDFGNQENKICYCFHFFPIYLPWSYGTRSSLVAQMIKRLPAMWETRVWSLGWEDPLEKEIATHSSILAWRIPWTEKPGGLQSMGSQRVVHDWATSFSFPFMGPDAMILVFWTLSFKPGFSLLSLTFVKMLFRSFSFSGTRVLSSVYLTLLIFPGQSWFHLVSHPTWYFACCTLYMGLPWWLSDKESICNAGDFLQCSRHGFNPWAGNISAEGNGKPLQYCCWEIP